MDPKPPAAAGGPAVPPKPGAAPAAPAQDEKDPAYKRSHFGLWCLDLLENIVAPPREAAAIERFDALGQNFHRHINAQFAVTFAALPLGAEEKLLVEGVDRRCFQLEDLLLFFKTSEGFLDPKEELKVVRKRYGAWFVLLKAALRLSRSALLGFTIEPKVPPDALKAFALLLREEPMPAPLAELQRLTAELKRRDIRGVQLIPLTELLSAGHMSAGARVLLTVMKRGLPAVTDRKALEAWAASFAKVGGPTLASDLVANVEHVLPAEQREVARQAIIGGLSVSELLAWRDALEKQGEELAAASLRETDPARRQGLEAQLKALPGLLKTVVSKIPPEVLEREASARRDKFTAQQDAKHEEQHAKRAKEAAAVLEADAAAFVKKLTDEREPLVYPRVLRQAADAFSRIAVENVALATQLVQVLQQHRLDGSLLWRKEAVTQALKEVATERTVARFVELLRAARPEERELGRLGLIAFGEPAVPQVWAAMSAADDAGPLTALLKDIGDAGEPAVTAALTAGGGALPPQMVRAGLQVLAHVKKADRFDFVTAYTKHPDSTVKEAAFRTLVALDTAKALPLVKRHVGDRDVTVASACLLLMGELRTNDPYVVKQMLDTVKKREKEQPEPDDRLQAASARALARLGNFKFGETTLEEYLLGLVRPREKKLLGFGGDKTREKSDAVRAAVCEALGSFGGEATMQALRALALEGPEVVKNGAREGLKLLAHRAKQQAK